MELIKDCINYMHVCFRKSNLKTFPSRTALVTDLEDSRKLAKDRLSKISKLSAVSKNLKSLILLFLRNR